MDYNSEELMEYNPTDISSQKELNEVIKSNSINCDVIIRGESIVFSQIEDGFKQEVERLRSEVRISFSKLDACH